MKGTFLTDALETWLGGYLYMWTIMSTQLWWLEIIVPAYAFLFSFQSGPKYFL
jgi:hypothetical protein